MNNTKCFYCMDTNYCKYCSTCFHCNSSVSLKSCIHCDSCTDCIFCEFCVSCENLVNGFMCINLHLKEKNSTKYWIFNKEVTKKEWDNRWKFK